MYSTSILSTVANKLQTLMGKRKLILTLGVIAVGIQSAMATSTETQHPTLGRGPANDLAGQKDDGVRDQKTLGEKDDLSVGSGEEAKIDSDDDLSRGQYLKKKIMQGFKGPFAKTAAAALGAGMGVGAYFVATKGVKSHHFDMANDQVTEKLGENVGNLYEGDHYTGHDLHDVMFNNMRNNEVIDGTAKFGDAFDISTINAEALVGNIWVYIMLGAGMLAVALMIAVYSSGGRAILGGNKLVEAGLVFGAVLTSGVLLAAGFSTNVMDQVNNEGANATAEWGQNGAIVAGIVLLGLVALYLIFFFIKDLVCPKKI